jgi:hypothetical protein
VTKDLDTSGSIPGLPPALRPEDTARQGPDSRIGAPARNDPEQEGDRGHSRGHLGFWLAVACAVVLLVAGAWFAYASRANEQAARDWKQRSIELDEQVNGLRTLIGERSAQLNTRTRQANRLAVNLRSTRRALRRSEGDVSSLARRQRQLANDKAQLEDQRRALQQQAGALETIASRYIDCKDALIEVIRSLVYQDYTTAGSQITVAQGSCNSAADALDAYVAAYG